MSEYWVVYRDVEGFPRKQFERLPAPLPGELRIRNQIFPGMFGKPDIYIRWHTVPIGDDTIRLLTYTEARVSIVQAAALAEQAFEQIEKSNEPH